jgi:adenylate cyclase
MAKSRLIFYLALTLLLTALAARLRETAPLQRAELLARDALHAVGRPAPRDPRLIFLGLDDASLSLDPELDLAQLGLDPASPEAAALREIAGQWPWPRTVHARVLDRLAAAGARVVAFDLLFPSETPHDAAFRAALERHADRVVIGGNYGTDASLGTVAFMPPSPTLVPDSRDGRVGFINFWSDADGVVRAARYATTLEQASGRAVISDAELRRPSFAALVLRKAGLGARVPEGFADHALRLAGPPRAGFPARSLYEIFVPAYWEKNFGGGAAFRDAIVVLGAVGNWQHDEHPTPLGLMPGAEVQLNAINAAIQGEFLRPLPARIADALLLGAGLAAGVLGCGLRSPWVRLACFTALNITLAAAALLGFDRGWLVPVVAPLALLDLHGLLGFVFDFSLARQERARLRRTFERYLSRPVLDELLAQPQWAATLGGAQRPVTILFADIRDFSRVTATTEPQALVAQLNEYFTAMVACVFRYGGTLDKFVGDALMAVWGNARSAGPAEDARRAARCALEMRATLARLNARWAAQGRPVFEAGIGLNHGEVIAGNIGSPERMEFTVIGDAVNVAWRLQEHTKAAPGILAGASLAALLGAEFAIAGRGRFDPGDGRTLDYARLAEAAEATA